MSIKIECEETGVDVETPHVDVSLPRPASNCRIGVDKKSGRVKWCPDCEVIKYLLILPLILLPVIVVFVLMMRISSTFTGRIEIVPATERIQMQTELEAYHRTSRSVDELLANINQNCELYRNLLATESIDIHDKELFRDTRTSFIPSELWCRSRNVSAIPHNINNVDDPPQTVPSKNAEQLRRWINKYAEPVEFNRLNLRRRRRQIAEQIVKNASVDSTKEPADDKPLEIPAFLRTFWKGGKTYEQIRNSQVEIMKQFMDANANPCDDFYQYACGNWESQNPIPKDKAAYDTFEMLREILDIELNSLLSGSKVSDDGDANTTEMPPNDFGDVTNSIEANIIKRSENTHRTDVDAEQKAKHLYESCMNVALLEERKLDPLMSLLDELGGWPVLAGDKWNASQFDWLELAAKLRLYNNDVFLMQWVGPDIKNSNENIIQFDQNSLGLPTRDYFIKSTNIVYLEAYQKFAKEVMFLCGASENASAKVADEVIRFEIELAKIMASPNERINVSQLYQRMTVGTLSVRVPEIDWRRYLGIVLEQKIDRDEVIVIFAINFMQELVQLLNTTEPRTVANYMLWKFVRHRINSLDDRFQDAKQEFYNVLIGRKKSPPRWKTCVNQVNSNMGMAVGAMFVREYFDDSSKQDTLAMTYELQDTFREILKETPWLDDETKALAESKVNRMSLKIGYPDYILDADELNKKYTDLQIHPERYFENILNVLRHLTRCEQNKLREHVNRTTWNTAPAVVNAYYSRNKNQIIFPAAILQPPFYHRHLPRSFNFGGIGVVIGHEL